MKTITKDTELLNYLENITEEKFTKITIKEEKYQFEIEPTGITNRIPDMFTCWKYDGNSYKETTLNNIISCIQTIGFIEAVIEE